jgi:hypothetical protein
MRLDLGFERPSAHKVQEKPGQTSNGPYEPTTDNVGMNPQANPSFGLLQVKLPRIFRPHDVGQGEFQSEVPVPFQMPELEDHALAPRPDQAVDDKAAVQNLSGLEAQTILSPDRMTHALHCSPGSTSLDGYSLARD